MSTTKNTTLSADMNGSTDEQYNWLDLLADIIAGSEIYFYFKEMVHPKPGSPLNPRLSAGIVFPDDYYAIFVANHKLESKKQLMQPHSILIWSTLDLPKSCGNDKELATQTMRMLATVMTLSGVDVIVNNKDYDPEKIIAENVHI